MGSRLSSPRPVPGTEETRQNHDLHLWNLHEMHKQDISHLVNELQLWSKNGHLNSQDHGDLLLRNNRECRRP